MNGVKLGQNIFMSNTYNQLKDGDLRSIGDADRVAAKAVKNPELIKELVAGISIDDAVIRMRCADALEKATRADNTILEQYSKDLMSLFLQEQPKEVLWHLLLLMPRIAWSRRELDKIFSVVMNCLSNSSSIVKTNALQALYELVGQEPVRKNEIRAIFNEASQAGTPAMRARAKKLLQQPDD